ncbi:MAG: DUF1249 domain-containing protein [Actinobacteria bacterium]|nr:DUF1249 domain-containing protein [Actinomycetota bacterium]
MTLTIYERIFAKLEKILGEDMEDIPQYQQFRARGFMELNVDLLHEDEESVTIALSHYFKQNGDMIPDPDMEVRIYPEMKMAEALTYQDSFGYREVYPAPSQVYLKAKKDLNVFLNQWLSYILEQGFERVGCWTP